MWKLKQYLGRYKKQVIIGPLFKFTEAVLELFVPLVMARIIDIGVAGRDLPYVLKMGGFLLLLGVVGLGCALICQYSASVASQGVGTIPVSYTHLDVYKRQQSGSELSAASTGGA